MSSRFAMRPIASGTTVPYDTYPRSFRSGPDKRLYKLQYNGELISENLGRSPIQTFEGPTGYIFEFMLYTVDTTIFIGDKGMEFLGAIYSCRDQRMLNRTSTLWLPIAEKCARTHIELMRERYEFGEITEMPHISTTDLKADQSKQAILFSAAYDLQ